MTARLTKRDIEQENKISEVMIDMGKIQTDIKYIKDNIQDIKKFINNADNRYAPKSLSVKVAEHESKLNSLKIRFATWTGGLIVIYIIAQVLINLYL
jgi:peptidoglycan hydrolase CwlO-like protein